MYIFIYVILYTHTGNPWQPKKFPVCQNRKLTFSACLDECSYGWKTLVQHRSTAAKLGQPRKLLACQNRKLMFSACSEASSLTF